MNDSKFLHNVKHMHPHSKNSVETSTILPPEEKLEAQQSAPCGLHGAACCASFSILFDPAMGRQILDYDYSTSLVLTEQEYLQRLGDIPLLLRQLESPSQQSV